VSRCAQHSEEDKQARGGNVCPPKEGVLSTDPGDRREYEGFCAFVRENGEVWGGRIGLVKGDDIAEVSGRTEADDNSVSALGHCLGVITPVELGEGGQASGTHPVLEVLICLEIGGRVGLSVAIRVAERPIGRRDDVAEAFVAAASNGTGNIFLGFPGPGNAL